jgi:hypothetical protein
MPVKSISWVLSLGIMAGALAVGALLIIFAPQYFGWGLAAVVLWIVLGCLPGAVQGEDGLWSTSKFQLFLWTGAIGYCLVIYQAFHLSLTPIAGGPGAATALPPFPSIPGWMWIALGMSSTTALGAKGITVGYLQSKRLQPSSPSDPSDRGWLGLITNDSGVPEITKMQMLFWTILAVIYVVCDATISLRHAINVKAVAVPALPELGTALLVLTGLGQGTYLGNKLFDAEHPQITGLDKSAGRVGDMVAIYGSNFGPTFEGQRVELDGTPVTPESSNWSPSQFQFKIPAALAGQAWPAAGKVVAVRVVVREVVSANDSKLTVMP